MAVHEVRTGRHLYIIPEYGNPRGQLANLAALFVHGVNGDYSQFGDQITALNEAGATCYCYDMLGCGKSHKPRLARLEDQMQLYSVQEHYKDLQVVLKRFVVSKVRCTVGRDSR